MTKEVDWGNINDSGNGDGGGNKRPKATWLKVPNGGSCRVRLVSNPVEYRKWWEPVSGYSPGFDTDPVVAAGYKPTRSYGLYVIDRNDNEVKVYSCSKKIVMIFKEWSNIKGCAPNDPEKGSDWVISKKRVDNKWTYTAMNDDTTPLTDAEKKRVDQVTTEAPLTEVFRPDTVERLQELLDEALANPNGPVPGGWEWYQAKKAQREAGSGNAGGVKFDDNKTDLADTTTTAATSGTEAATPAASADDTANEKFDTLFESGEQGAQGEGTTLF